MAKDLKEQIEIMTHYLNGGEVECVEKGNDNWETFPSYRWNWKNFDYRIKEPKQKVTIEKWLVKDTDGVYRIIETSMADKLYFKKIKLLDTYEVEL